ncbi:MAG: septum formation initiator family protein [Euzebyaceae bacterium]|nr:septum formation initiator family protein [Euzebyaceae bacterium]
MTGRRRPPPGPRRRRRRGRLRRSAAGDRLSLLAVVVLVVVLLGAMAVRPLQSYTAAAARVDELTATQERLEAGVDELSERRAALEDPEQLELLAREEHGLVRPGEIPYVVVTPEPEDQQIRPRPPEPDPRTDGPWYRRLTDAVRELFG